MKKILFIFAATMVVSAVYSRAGGATKAMPDAAIKAHNPQTAGTTPQKLKKYTMDNNYFTCNIPDGWRLEREKDRDEEYKIYEIELIAPRAEKAPTAIYVSYYAKDNADFDGYGDFIERNSQNVLGETKNDRESYEPVKKTPLNGRKASVLSRTKTTFLHPESKSGESVKLKEKLYILPAKDGFYVLHFSAAETAFQRNLKIFEQVAKSFKGRQ
jgi:hypothetical protein